MDNSKTAVKMNSLLRGELAALETYRQALEKVHGDPAAAELQRLCDVHAAAVSSLRQRVIVHGGEPDVRSGAWGAFAAAVEGAAKLFGDAAAIAALKQGEKQGIADYEAALLDADLAEDCLHLIESRLLPETRAHVLALEAMPHG